LGLARHVGFAKLKNLANQVIFYAELHKINLNSRFWPIALDGEQVLSIQPDGEAVKVNSLRQHCGATLFARLVHPNVSPPKASLTCVPNP